MANKSRVPMQVAPEFNNRMKHLQEEIMKKKGKVVSIRDLTQQIIGVSAFENIEKDILNLTGLSNIDINIKFDRRGK